MAFEVELKKMLRDEKEDNMSKAMYNIAGRTHVCKLRYDFPMEMLGSLT